MTNLLLIFSIVGAFALITFTSYRREKKLWNNGICPKCNVDWEYFDTDSQGGRGYVCTECGEHIWVTWHR